MLLSQQPPTYTSAHTHSRRRPKLSLNITTAVSAVPHHLSTTTSTPLSPTTRNTMQNKYMTSASRLSESDSSDDEYTAPRRVGMTSSYHPTTPKAGFYGGSASSRRVMFSETVVVIPRD